MTTRTPVKLPEPGYTELFGWPVTILDELVGLAHLAYDDQIGIAEWRATDAELRRECGLPAVPAATFGPLYVTVTQAYLSGPADSTIDEYMERLMDRTRALVPPPDDATLTRRLQTFAQQLDAPADQPAGEATDRDDLITSLARLRRWLDGDAVRDPGCGLLVEAVERHREVPDETFGFVPLSPAEARARAWAAADDAARAEARQYLGHDADHLLGDALIAHAASAEADRQVLLRLVRTAEQQRERPDGCGDAAGVVWRLWTGGGLRVLFDEVLDGR